MKTVTKQNLINDLRYATDLDPLAATKAVEIILKSIKYELLKGNQICIRGFATIKPAPRKAKVARNIHKNEPMILPPSTTIKLVPAKSLVKQLNAKSYQNIF